MSDLGNQSGTGLKNGSGGPADYDHEVLVDSVDSITPVKIECPACGHEYREKLSPRLGGSSCPDCTEMIGYTRREEYRERQRDDRDETETEQTTLIPDGGNELRTVPVDKPPRHFLGNLLIDGPDGQCSYFYSGIDERCSNNVDAHTFVEHGGEMVRVEMCAEHAREDVPSREEWEQEVLA